MNDKIRSKAIVAHNYRRSRLAQGLVKNKNQRNLPSAKNMLRLVLCFDFYGSYIKEVPYALTRCVPQ
nr:SCP extracellular domain containing protein [Haemonchus contortus]